MMKFFSFILKCVSRLRRLLFLYRVITCACLLSRASRSLSVAVGILHEHKSRQTSPPLLTEQQQQQMAAPPLDRDETEAPWEEEGEEECSSTRRGAGAGRP